MRGERDGKPRAAVSRRGDAVDLPDTIGGSERIARRLARAGIASRRDAEMLVETGRVSVNGTVLTSPAVNVTAQDRIEIDGEPIPAIERTRLLLFHKPAGVVTTNRDPEGRKTVFDVLPEGLPRLMTVGRLDINTEGLLLLTNDGGLARMLELPSTGWLRRYRVRVHGKVDERELQKLRDGVALEGVYYGSVEATLDREQGSNAWLTLGLREGKNREVKKILGSLGLDVTRLIRVSYGPFQLGELAEGTVQELKGRTLREQLGERLIADAGANFDAPIITPFSNSPVAAEAPRAEPKRQGRGRLDVEDGGLVRARNKDRLDRLDRRDKALGRLQTRRPDASRDDERKPRAEGKPRGEGRAKPVRKADRDGPPMAPERPGSRSSYVWMAPGARPDRTPSAGSDKPAREEGRTKPSGSPARPQGKGRPPRQDGGRPTRNDGPRKPAGPRGAKPGRGPKGR